MKVYFLATWYALEGSAEEVEAEIKAKADVDQREARLRVKELYEEMPSAPVEKIVFMVENPEYFVIESALSPGESVHSSLTFLFKQVFPSSSNGSFTADQPVVPHAEVSLF